MCFDFIHFFYKFYSSCVFCIMYLSCPLVFGISIPMLLKINIELTVLNLKLACLSFNASTCNFISFILCLLICGSVHSYVPVLVFSKLPSLCHNADILGNKNSSKGNRLCCLPSLLQFFLCRNKSNTQR